MPMNGATPRSFAGPWLFLTASLAAHVFDEAVTGFLTVYNATVLALRQQWGWFRALTFSRGQFLFLMITTVVLCFALTPFAARGARWMRALAWLAVVIQFANAMGHTIGTILGHTVATVTFPRPAPGFYSSPLLFAGSIWLAVRLRKTDEKSETPAGISTLRG
jgi:hypothetical protein